MPQRRIDGQPTSFKCEADLRVAMLEEFGKQGMGAYLRRLIRADMEARGRVRRRDAAPEAKAIPPAAPGRGTPPDHRPASTARSSTSPVVEEARSKKSGAIPKKSDPRYSAWMSMKQRIPVWDDFATFAGDMGTKPPGMMLLRHDKTQPHGPTNSFWGTVKERNRALPRSRTYLYKGQEYTLGELARETKVHPSTLSARLRKGIPIEKAVGPVVGWGGPGRVRPRR